MAAQAGCEAVTYPVHTTGVNSQTKQPSELPTYTAVCPGELTCPSLPLQGPDLRVEYEPDVMHISKPSLPHRG